MPNDNITERVVVQVNCPGKSIVDFISTVPRGMDKSNIINASNGQYSTFTMIKFVVLTSSVF